MVKAKAKTKDQIIAMLKGVEQRRHSFLRELGEEYDPIVDFDKLKNVMKSDLLKLGEEAIRDASNLANRVIERREQAETVIDEVNQFNSSSEASRQPMLPPISLKRPMNERAFGVELHEAKEKITHLQRDNAQLQGQVALLNRVVEQFFGMLGNSMNDQQKKECTSTLLMIVEKLAAQE